MTVYVDHSGGIKVTDELLKKFFPNLKYLKKSSKNKLGHLTIDDMSRFTHYVETRNQ